MAIVDGIIQPHYAWKSIIKICLFIIIPLIYILYNKQYQIFRDFIISKKSLKIGFLLGSIVYLITVFGYFLVKNWIDFSNITVSLNESVHVTKENFIYVALYISIINSFIEEIFFRGFNQYFTKHWKYICSVLFCSVLFALYHVAMMIGWYDIFEFSIAIFALFIIGVFFHYINKKTGSIFTSWIVHFFANFGVNTVGLILFGIL